MRCQAMWVSLVFVAIVPLGCKPALNQVNEFDLPPDGSHDFEMPDIGKEQKVQVQVTSTANVNVFVYFEKDKKAAERDLVNPKKESTNFVAKSVGQKEATLEATIPADTKWIVHVTPASGVTAKVVVKITN